MVQNAAMPRGRPRSFDETEALERAIQVFWSKGYDGVTIDDLVAGMGVGRPSLYAVFGDKRTIFLRALKIMRRRKALTPRRHCSRRRRFGDSLDRLPEVRRRNCDRERIRSGMSYRVRRAACGRC